MENNLRTDLLDVLGVLYEHGYTPEQALERIQKRVKQELVSLQEKESKGDEEEQTTVKLVPKKSFEVPLKIDKESVLIRAVLQEEDTNG